MKKHLLPFAFAFFISHQLNYSQGAAIFNANQIETEIFCGNSQFWDQVGQAGYFFPAGSNTSTLFTANLWVAGKDSVTNELRGFGDMYHTNGQDTWPGPLTTDGTASITPLVSSNYDKVWKVTETDVVNYINAWNNGSVTNLTYPIPPDMLSWPAHGPLGYSQTLSPFFDNNGDGLYDPYTGDYPIIKGTQMLRWIMNDKLNVHTETNGNPIGFEVQADFYGCSSSNPDDPINRTSFLTYKIINRTNHIYKDLYMGLNIDADLGVGLDDYIRSNVSANTVQFYNADGYDGSLGTNPGYLGNPPVQSVTVVAPGTSAQPLISGFMYYNNGSSVIGNPQSLDDQYKLLQSEWLDGTHLTYGGNGYGDTLLCRYMFAGNSDPLHYGTYGIAPAFNWTEENNGSGTNPAGDRRGVMSMGPYTMMPNTSIQVTFALITTQDSTLDSETLLQKNITEVNQIRQAFSVNNLPCQHQYVGIDSPEEPDNIFIYPNPTSNWFTIQSEKPIDRIEILDLNGRVKKTYLNHSQFSTEDLPAGMYLMYIYVAGEKQTRMEKLMIAK
jgi:hypothetical protein